MAQVTQRGTAWHGGQGVTGRGLLKSRGGEGVRNRVRMGLVVCGVSGRGRSVSKSTFRVCGGLKPWGGTPTPNPTATPLQTRHPP